MKCLTHTRFYATRSKLSKKLLRLIDCVCHIWKSRTGKVLPKSLDDFRFWSEVPKMHVLATYGRHHFRSLAFGFPGKQRWSYFFQKWKDRTHLVLIFCVEKRYFITSQSAKIVNIYIGIKMWIYKGIAIVLFYQDVEMKRNRMPLWRLTCLFTS